LSRGNGVGNKRINTKGVSRNSEKRCSFGNTTQARLLEGGNFKKEFKVGDSESSWRGAEKKRGWGGYSFPGGAKDTQQKA